MPTLQRLSMTIKPIDIEMNYRIFVEKKPQFRVEAKGLENDLNVNLGLNINGLRLINVYDLLGFTPELVEKTRFGVFGEIVTDSVVDALDLTGVSYLAIESLPGQFDQRAASAVDCVKLVDPTADVAIKCARLLLFPEKVDEATMERIRKYTINAVECREKDMARLGVAEQSQVNEVSTLDGFRNMTPDQYEGYCRQNGLAMNADDLACVVEYFRNEGRDPYHTELMILDTYWSDHCRHTTFTTVLEEITVDESFIKTELEDCLALYHNMRAELDRGHKDVCLMDLATVGARYLRKHGYLDDMEQSEENNACSILVNVNVADEKTGREEIQRWLLQFKNETHNHPTEIEPFGGASTCLGGAIRDPLSGRAYVYQAMRVTGAGDIYTPIADTMPGKLPQRIISAKATAGYSSYGNQIGLATTHLREIYHPDYVAKRMEVGAVVGAVRADAVRRESPAPGDVVLMFGGRTGRDGVGGATGSSKEHNEQSLETCSSEVQKGNAPEERKLERLFRRPEVTSLIKKSNDFGAGGVSVAIGELTDGLDIYLDRVKTKYDGLNATELAISESQERISVVIEAKDMEQFMAYCHSENIEVVHIADVTDTARMRMFYKGNAIVDLSREFIDSAGAKHFAKARIAATENRNPFVRTVAGNTLEERFVANLTDDNVLTQKGMIETFDATIGASTVLMPFGGATQRTETQVGVQKLPIGEGFTNDASMMAYGFNPFVSKWSPFHGAAYAVVEACTKVVAAGGRYDTMRFSYQEYFERMSSLTAWGKPLSALLGALKMQHELHLPSIGGKDSMSGTFKDINVPPTLIAFGITMVDARNVISTDFKRAGENIYILRHTPTATYMPDTAVLRKNYDAFHKLVEQGVVTSAYALGMGGLAEAIAKMSFGSNIGCDINYDEAELFNLNYGSIVLTTNRDIDCENFVKIGTTVVDNHITINGKQLPQNIDELYAVNTDRLAAIYPTTAAAEEMAMPAAAAERKAPVYPGEAVENPRVYIPVFPGTNCDYDLTKVFRRAGAEVVSTVFCNLDQQMIENSINVMAAEIRKAHILALAGGFSAGDEPDGSAKFIATVLNNKQIAAEVEALIARGGLIIGICNGFQALVKSGLLPYGHLGMVTEESPTLFRNNINRHISQMVTTRISTVASPWLSSFRIGEQHTIAMSHGEGKFVVSPELAEQLFAKGQVAFQYVDGEGNITMKSPYNPNGSSYAIEGIISENGQILGKMGHSERYEPQLFKNISGNMYQPLFENAVNYFRKK